MPLSLANIFEMAHAAIVPPNFMYENVVHGAGDGAVDGTDTKVQNFVVFFWYFKIRADV